MTAAELLPYRCDEKHAREITDQIRAGVEKVHQLLIRSYEWEAWRALGYASWRDYATTEFGISKSRAYQLLDQARVIKEIESAAEPFQDPGNLNSEQTRVLAPIIREHGPEAAAEVLTAASETGKPTAAAIRQAASAIDRAKSPAEPRSHRRPLPDAFWKRSYDLAKTAKSLHNLTADDRWTRNAEQVARYRNDLLRTRDLIDQVLAAMPDNSPEG